MTSKRIKRTTLTTVFFLMALPVFAHHGASEYDMTKILTLHATVTQLLLT